MRGHWAQPRASLTLEAVSRTYGAILVQLVTAMHAFTAPLMAKSTRLVETCTGGGGQGQGHMLVPLLVLVLMIVLA